MMNFYKCLTGLCLCLVTASAQEEAKVKMKVDLVAWGNAIPNLTLKKAEGVGVVAKSFTYSKTLTYSGPQILAVYQVKGNAAASPAAEGEREDRPSGQAAPEKKVDLSNVKDPMMAALLQRKIEEPELVALVKLPLSSRHVTVLLAPAGKGIFQPYVIDDDPRKLPAGKLRVHNLSGFAIRMEQIKGPQKCQLDPKEDFVFRGDKDNRFTYRVKYKRGDKWKSLSNNQIVLSEKKQSQFVILKSDNSHFISSDGTKSGFLQSVVLERNVD